MAQIKITIKIPDHEYMKWNEFHCDGEILCAQSIRKQIKERLKQDYISEFEIESEIEK